VPDEIDDGGRANDLPQRRLEQFGGRVGEIRVRFQRGVQSVPHGASVRVRLQRVFATNGFVEFVANGPLNGSGILSHVAGDRNLRRK
jgi:hypothetical protein